jgi:glycosyltransferase involved in cell wall biosynthesis
MQECDVFSMPSTNEAFGVVYIEAMSLGKPVIGCIGEGPQDIIDHEENGYLMIKNDVEQLSAILDQLFSDKVLQQQLGEKAKRTVEEKFQWNNVAKKLIEEYKNLI